jgi:hypothetical protein
MFVRGRLGNYYLSQFAAGQILDANGVPVDPNVNPKDANSPAVDAGSGYAIQPNIRMHLYSTRTDNVKDVGRVDIGFHYNDPCAITYFDLRIYIDPVGTGLVSFTDPNRNDINCPPNFYVRGYKQYAQVPLLATPIDPKVYQFKSWQGTDNDALKELTNIVTMDSNKSVRVQFETILVYLRCRVINGNGDVSPRSISTRHGGQLDRNTSQSGTSC